MGSYDSAAFEEQVQRIVGDTLSRVRYIVQRQLDLDEGHRYLEQPQDWDWGSVHSVRAVEFTTSAGRAFTVDRYRPEGMAFDEPAGWHLGTPCRRPDYFDFAFYEGTPCSLLPPDGAETQEAYDAAKAEVAIDVTALPEWQGLVGQPFDEVEVYWTELHVVNHLLPVQADSFMVRIEPHRLPATLRFNVGGEAVYLSRETKRLREVSGRSLVERDVFVVFVAPDRYDVGPYFDPSKL